MPRSVTMAQVAQEAEVSISTVSHVLNGTRRVAHETRHRVLSAVERLGYRHEPTVRSLEVGDRPLIGIVGPVSSYASVANQVERLAVHALDSHMTPVTADSYNDPHVEAEIVASLVARNVDAIAIAPTQGWRRHALLILRNHRIPFVIIEQLDEAVLAHQFSTNYKKALSELTGHLFDHGLRRLVLLHSDRGLTAGVEQLSGFLDAHRERGYHIEREQILSVSQSAEAGRRVTLSLLECQRPDGIIISSSTLVPGVLDAVRGAGLRPGLDISLTIVADDLRYVPDPNNWTRANIPFGAVAERTLVSLRSLLRGGFDSPRIETLGAEITYGASCGCGEHRRVPSGQGEESLAESRSGKLSPSGHGRRIAAGTDPSNALTTASGYKNSKDKNTLITLNEETGLDVHFPSLHVRPRCGWVNDPNGIHKIGDTWHLFYQYNPNSPWHDRICWGHASSTDLVNWEARPVALKPRRGEADAAGCWSGVGLVHEGTSTLIYSGVREMFGSSSTVMAQQRADASGWDPVGVVAEMPPDSRVRTMRDPFLFTFDGTTYAIFGAGLDDGTPAITLYDCSDWAKWRYIGLLLTGDDIISSLHAPASVWECPQLVQIDGTWVLIVSLWVEAEELMDHLTGVAYLVGDLRQHNDRLVFTARDGGRADNGPDFYAPQCVVDGERTLLWGWSWEGMTRTPLEIEEAGYNGSLTYPRELSLHNGHLTMRPARELTALRESRISPRAISQEHSFEIVFSGSGAIRLIDRASAETIVQVDATKQGHVLVDGSMIEVFHEGQPSTTRRAYPQKGFVIEAEQEVELTVWRLRATAANGERTSNALRGL